MKKRKKVKHICIRVDPKFHRVLVKDAKMSGKSLQRYVTLLLAGKGGFL